MAPPDGPITNRADIAAEATVAETAHREGTTAHLEAVPAAGVHAAEADRMAVGVTPVDIGRSQAPDRPGVRPLNYELVPHFKSSPRDLPS